MPGEGGRGMVRGVSGNGPGDTLVGSVIDGRYRIDGKIGEGGIGAVYQGEHVVVGNRVAIKVLHPEYSRDEDVIRRLAIEARIAGTLGHRNIVQVYDFAAMEDGTHYIVMELLDGETLAQYLLREGPVDAKFIVPVAMQILEALGAAHARSVVHRDLKPDNVFLTRSADAAALVKILDFGISKIRSPGSDDFHLTKTGTVLGTPYFMSPEQATGKKDVDQRTDIYALGVILYFALTGTYPFKGDTYNELIVNIFSEEPPPPRAVRPDIPEAVERVILKAMAKQRDGRFADAAEFSRTLQTLLADPALKDVFGGMTSSALIRSAHRRSLASQPPPTPMTWTAKGKTSRGSAATTEPGPRKRRAPWIALGLLLAAAGGVTAFLAAREGGDDTSDGRVDVAAAAVQDAGAEPESIPADPIDVAAALPAREAHEAAERPDAAPPTQPEVVVVRVSATPDTAGIKIDGADVPNPFERRCARDGPDLRVEVAARGFETVVRFVPCDADKQVAVELDRARDGQRPVRDAGGRVDHERSETGAAPPTPPPPPPPPVDAPAIDRDNPFGRPGRGDAGQPGPR